MPFKQKSKGFLSKIHKFAGPTQNTRRRPLKAPQKCPKKTIIVCVSEERGGQMKRILGALWCGLWLFSAQATPPTSQDERQEQRPLYPPHAFAPTRNPHPHCTCLSKTDTAIVASMGSFLSSICCLSMAFFAVERERDPLLQDIFYGSGGVLGALGVGLGILSCGLRRNPRTRWHHPQNPS